MSDKNLDLLKHELEAKKHEDELRLSEKRLEVERRQTGRFSGGAVTLIGAAIGVLSAVMTTVLGGYFGLQTTEKDNRAQFELKQEEVLGELEIKRLEVQGQIDVAKLSAEAERERLEIQQKFEIIVQATKGLPAEDAVENLLFFVEAGILEDRDGKIAKLVEQGNAPVLPAPPAPQAQVQATPAQMNLLLERKEDILSNTSREQLFAKTDADFIVLNGVLLGREENMVAHIETPHVGRAPNESRYVMAHYAPANSISSVVTWYQNPAAQASSHVIIGRDGAVIQMVLLDHVAYHAGRAKWGRLRSLNNTSVGVELVNHGLLKASSSGGWRTQLGYSVPADRVVARQHKFALGREMHWEVFDQAQLLVTTQVMEAIAKSDLDVLDLIGHDDVAPTRKLDPGPAFPMEDIREVVFGRREALPPPN